MKIATMADIHIQQLQRHEEFKTVFTKLFEDLRKSDVDIIVIAGDIYHSKLIISPEADVMLNWFFTELSKTKESIVIPGNHDANITNSNRTDALSPFIDRVNAFPKNAGFPTYPIHYFDCTGIYAVSPISKPDEFLRVFTESILDDFQITEDEIKASNSLPFDYTLGILHGTFQGSEDEEGFKLQGEALPDWTNICDFVILGDIHKRQTLQFKEI